MRGFMFLQEITAERRRYQLLNNVAGDVRKKTKPRNPGSNKSKVGKKSSTTGKSRTTKGNISPKTSVKDEPKGNSLFMLVAIIHGNPFNHILCQPSQSLEHTLVDHHSISICLCVQCWLILNFKSITCYLVEGSKHCSYSSVKAISGVPHY